MGDRVEGRNAVGELLASGRRVQLLRVMDSTRPGDPLDSLRREAERAGVTVEVVSRRLLDKESARGAHQGVIAYVEEFQYTALAEVLATAANRECSLLVALDHVTDPGNLGAIVRTAEVAGADGVIIPRDRAAGMTSATFKAAAGAAEHVAVSREANLHRALGQCKDAGYWVVGASEHADELAWDAPMSGRTVLVMGNEGSGLARLTERTCDVLVRLPVAGHVSSLNVSAATAVLAFEWLRQCRDYDPGTSRR
jgi:23S rRNA (guanosine2251-2'-O)-methyltransferase